MQCPPDPCWPVPLRPSYLPRQSNHCCTEICVQVTHRVTRHPVCMTVRGVKPPCLPVYLHNRDLETDRWQHDDAPEEESLWDEDRPEGLYIEPTSVLR